MLDRHLLQAMTNILCSTEAQSNMLDEQTAVGWIVLVLDQMTDSAAVYGPWDPHQQLEATKWADEHVRRFSAAGDDGVPLQTTVFPMWAPLPKPNDQ